MKNIFVSKIWILFAGALVFALLYFTGIGCPVKYISGISCPGCGITHAIVDCLHLDFKAAISHNPAVFLLLLLFVWFIKDGKIFKNRKLNNIFFSVLIGLFGIYFVAYLFC